MVLSDMDDEDDFLAVINENDLFGHDGDTGPSSFSWADEFLSTAEGDGATTSSVAQNHETISPTEVVPASLENHHQLASHQTVVSTQGYVAAGPTVQGSLPLGGVQMVQATGLVQQSQVQSSVSTVQQPIAMPSLSQLTQGTGNQIVQGPNGQLILKPVSGGQIYLQAQPHLQTLQPSSSPVSQIGQFQGTPQVINRILAPNQSPQTSSHAPATSPQVSRSLTPVQSLAGMGPVTMVTSKGQGHIMTAAPNVNVLQLPSNAQQQQVLTRNLPIQLSNANTGINLQGPSAVLQQAQGQGSIVQQGQGHGTLLQQGQGQAAVLPGQGQNIVNTQNTVIQNPNVVNLNVAHVLCNNPQLQNQSSSTVHHMAAASNIQGTLIQTADGKNIIIPNQQMPQGQSINIQNLPQMTIQPQLNLAQPSNSTVSSMMGNTPTVLQGNLALGNLGNVIRLTTNTGSAQPEAKPQTQVNTTAGATHFIGLNQQGQQILIQRNPTPTGQQQNIILRAVNPSNIVLPQQQTAAGVAVSTAQLQTNQTVTTQPMMMSSQPQSVQIQRIMTNAQGQQVKFVGQGGIQTPLTINIGSNLSNLPSGVQTIQVLPQQQVAKPVNNTIVGSDNTNQTSGVISNVHQQSSVQQQQVIPILTSQSVNSAQNSGLVAKQAVSFSQNIQQLQPHVSITTNATPAVHTSQTSHQQMTKFITSTSVQQQPIQDPQVSESPQQLAQTLQNVQIPISSQFQTSQAVPNFSTANATTVTTTVTQSRVQLAMSTPNAQVVPSVALQQGIATQKSQQILQAKDNAPRLQHTIQISVEAQQHLARIQTEIKRLSSQKTLNNTQKSQLNNLMDAQKKILSQGQLVRQVQHLQHSTAPAPITQHLLNQQSGDKQQALGQATPNLIGQDVKPLTIKQIPQQPLIGQQSSKVTGQLPLKQENMATVLSLKHYDRAGIMGSVTSQPQHIQPQQETSLAGPSVKGNLVIKTEPSTSLSSSCAFSQTDIQSQTNLPSSQIKLENPISTSLSTGISANPTTSIITEKSQIPATVSTNPSAMIHHVAPPPPGKVPIAASPQVAVPTQIKIGNHILNLSLTPQQKEKVLGYLSKMTPEMQQQQISTFLKLQQQQQLQVQVQAQVKAQQNLQQQKQQQQQQPQQKRIVTSVPVQNTGTIPLTVQQIDSSGTVKTGEQIPATKVVTATQGPHKRVSFASLSTTDLIHQQLSKDQDNAVNPDTKTPFKGRRDTYRRLLRYHVYQSKHPPPSVMQKDEEMFQEVSQCLLQKKDRMFDKFRILLLQESMREKKTAEMLMIQRLLNEDLTETVKAEKEIVKTNPDQFMPMPMKYLQHEDKANIKSDSYRETIIKQENLDSEPISVKQESMTPSRPSTPKVKLVIRSDGQNFTSSLAADSNSGSDGSEGGYHDSGDAEERLEHEEDSVKHEMSGILLDNSNFLHVKQEQMDEEESAIFEKTKHWEGCGEKPFHGYVDEGDDSIMDSGCGIPLGDSGQDYNSVSSDGASNGVENEVVHSVSGYHDEEEDMDDDDEDRNDTLSSSFETSGAVGGLMSDSDLTDFPTHYHSQDKQSVGESLFDGRKHLFHSQEETKLDSGMTSNSPPSPNKQLYGSQNLFSDDEKVPFSQSELLSESGESNSTVARQDSASSLVENETSSNNISSYPRSGHASLAQYEPISSPEADHEDSFANMITHRVDSSYIINIGDQKSSSQLSVPDLSFSATSFSSSQTLDMKSTTSIDISDEETTLYSDSDKETDQQDEILFKDQMQKAINSIVSLNQDSSPYTQDHQSNNFFSQHGFDTNPASQSEDLTFQHSPTPSIKEEKDDEVSMDDDLDAAVQSILT